MNTLNARELDQLKRRQAERDYSVKPCPRPNRSRGSQMTRADWERLSAVLSDWARS
jgi:hypothetical protein